MAKASNVTFKIDAHKLPLFQKTIMCIEKEFLTKAHRSNEEYTRGKIDFKNESQIHKLLTFDPQTSGGLLLSVGAEAADKIVAHLAKDFPGTAIIGEVITKTEFDVIVH